MTLAKLRIQIPVAAQQPRGNGPRRRFGYLAAELILTVCMSFAILLGVLRMLGLAQGSVALNPDEAYPPHFDASSLGILRVTIACTVLVYTGMEGGAALLRVLRRRSIPSAPREASVDYSYDGMRALEAGWREPFAIVRVTNNYGSVDGRVPFAMAPARAATTRG